MEASGSKKRKSVVSESAHVGPSSSSAVQVTLSGSQSSSPFSPQNSPSPNLPNSRKNQIAAQNDPNGPLAKLKEFVNSRKPLQNYPDKDGDKHIISEPHIPRGNPTAAVILHYETRGIGMQGKHRTLRTSGDLMSHCWQLVALDINSSLEGKEGGTDFFDEQVASCNACPLVLPHGTEAEVYMAKEDLDTLALMYREVLVEFLSYIEGNVVPFSQASFTWLNRMFIPQEMMELFKGGIEKSGKVVGVPGTSHPERILKYGVRAEEVKEWENKVSYVTGSSDSKVVKQIFSKAGGTAGALLMEKKKQLGSVLGGQTTKEDIHKADSKRAFDKLMEKDTNLDPEVAMEIAEDEATNLATKRKANRTAFNKSNQGKTRTKYRKLEEGSKEKANYDKRNAAAKGSRVASQKKRWKCKSCTWTCTHGSRSKTMPKHLKRNPQCRVSENDYLSSFEPDGWE
ncbi:hypothetical protein TrCOL_g10882 [Triparma columacea]|uniref:Uncharacterized protein n=1 Tax=Triparma columacea TaxID=722753 RepID=A0A9W7L3U3_9STRA|nr:hypothetical protein TrCOL_g10882 [Triparma columacea]